MQIMDKEAFMAITEEQAVKMFRYIVYSNHKCDNSTHLLLGTINEIYQRLANTIMERRRQRRVRRRKG